MTDEDKAVAEIHPLAVVHPNAKIGKGAVIGPFTVIGENVEIGEGTVVSSNVVITGWTRIGKDCKIYMGASIGEEPQDLKFAGEKSFVEIGDRTKIHEYVTIHRGTGENTVTRIGNDTLLMAYVHVAHNCEIGDNVVMANAAMAAGHVIIGDRVVIAGKAGIHQFVRIGRNAMVGGMSKNIHDIVPYTIVDGMPAKAIGLNSVGIARAGISPSIRKNIKQAYRLLYRSGYSLPEAIAAIEQEVESSEEIEYLLKFLREADRGICRANRINKKSLFDGDSSEE